MLSDAQWEEISSEFNIKPYPHPNSGLPPDFFERRFREALGYCCSGYLYPNSAIDFDHNPKEEVRVLLRLVEKLDDLVDYAKSLEGMNSTDFEKIIRRNLRIASGGLEYDPDASGYEITMDAIASLELYSQSAKASEAGALSEGPGLGSGSADHLKALYKELEGDGLPLPRISADLAIAAEEKVAEYGARAAAVWLRAELAGGTTTMTAAPLSGLCMI